MILRCRLCHAAIAAFDPADVSPPFSGAMFRPLKPGFPPPFVSDASWDAARCPFCRHHPQGYEPDGRRTLATDDGDFAPAAHPAAQNRQRKRGRA